MNRQPCKYSKSLPLFLLASWLVYVATPGLGFAQTPKSDDGGLKITKILVVPSEPGPDTLCNLAVEIENSGSQIASQLEFEVRINDTTIPVYSNQVFMVPLAAGETSRVDLYNFWSTETSRPYPQSGRLEIEIRLLKAQWIDIGTEGDVEVWDPVGEIPGLPVRRTTSLSITK